jgi:hypothetical protein
MLYRSSANPPENGPRHGTSGDKGGEAPHRNAPHVALPPRTGTSPEPLDKATAGLPRISKEQVSPDGVTIAKPSPAAGKGTAERDNRVSVKVNPQRRSPIQDSQNAPGARALQLPTTLQPVDELWNFD